MLSYDGLITKLNSPRGLVFLSFAIVQVGYTMLFTLRLFFFRPHYENTLAFLPQREECSFLLLSVTIALLGAT